MYGSLVQLVVLNVMFVAMVHGIRMGMSKSKSNFVLKKKETNAC